MLGLLATKSVYPISTAAKRSAIGLIPTRKLPTHNAHNCIYHPGHNLRSIVSLSTNEIRTKFRDFFGAKHNHTPFPSAPLVPENDPSLLFTNAGMVQFKNWFLDPKSVAPANKRVTTIQQCIRAGGKHNDLDEVGKTPRHQTYFEMLGNFSFGAYGKDTAIKLAWSFLTEELQIPPHMLRVSVYKGDHEVLGLWEKQIDSSFKNQHDIDQNKAKEEGGEKMGKAGNRPTQIVELGDVDNFWSVGTEGPCGTCTEIFYKMYKPSSRHYNQNPTSTEAPVQEVEGVDYEWLEIWNIVFIDKLLTKNNQITKLDTLCIDTGMGLERLASVLQNKHSNFETDEFATLINGIKSLVNTNKTKKNNNSKRNSSVAVSDDKRIGASQDAENDQIRTEQYYRIIADHTRSASFLISQGVYPSNTGRGYVLRRILRRAIRSGHQLGVKHGFMKNVFFHVEATLGHVYKELVENRELIISVLESEETTFLNTLEKGLAVLNKQIKIEKAKIESESESESKSGTEQVSDNIRNKAGKLDINTVVVLYDTHGLPPDLTLLIAQEHGLEFDMNEFDEQLKILRNKNKDSWKAKSTSSIQNVDVSDKSQLDKKITNKNSLALQLNNQLVQTLSHSQNHQLSEFIGYHLNDSLKNDLANHEQSEQVNNHQKKGRMQSNPRFILKIDQNPFYFIGGGQPNDIGYITLRNNEGTAEKTKFNVIGGYTDPEFDSVILVEADKVDTRTQASIKTGSSSSQSLPQDNPCVIPSVGDEIECFVDREFRYGCSLHHTGTHMLLSALNKVLPHSKAAVDEAKADKAPSGISNSIKQAGSQLSYNKLRFDFTFNKKPTNQQILDIQATINEWAKHSLPITYSIDQEYTRTVVIGGDDGAESNDTTRIVSTESCGGTHLNNTADIYPFLITNETSVSSGVRRIEAVCGKFATEKLLNFNQTLLTCLDEQSQSQSQSQPQLQQSNQAATSVIPPYFANTAIINEFIKTPLLKAEKNAKVLTLYNNTLLPKLVAPKYLHTTNIDIPNNHNNNPGANDNNNNTVELQIHILPSLGKFDGGIKIPSWINQYLLEISKKLELTRTLNDSVNGQSTSAADSSISTLPSHYCLIIVQDSNIIVKSITTSDTNDAANANQSQKNGMGMVGPDGGLSALSVLNAIFKTKTKTKTKTNGSNGPYFGKGGGTQAIAKGVFVNPIDFDQQEQVEEFFEFVETQLSTPSTIQ
ncbi:Alanine-tRNA ligase [Zancudomyces culisetae]|uniref:alanine--tRNA ligase n=1 Tax=Zancudomyces culisetae TaxID=1213189 RepID=A0A1R1PT57_ZANCU|nr:Alanine-tRNA ligase [Zancudomyces culisetae]|eukprot:OMH84150.1 Alanine-tRNA ligase [Zancudomyces culisetae]